MKKVNFAIVTLGIFILLAIFSALASPVKSQTISPTPPPKDNGIKDSAQERLKKAIQEKSGQAKKILESHERRALVGSLKDLTSNTLTIQIKNGTVKIAVVGDSTAIIRKGKPVKLSDLAIGNSIIAMGYPGDNDTLDAKRVAVVDQPTPDRDLQIMAGKVNKIDVKNKIFTITVNRPTELGGPKEVEISVAKKTDLDVSKLSQNSAIILVAAPASSPNQPLVIKTFKIVQ